MSENTTGKTDRVKGKNVHGQVVVLTRSKPEQLGLFQTFLPEEEEKYSNTIELYDAVPKYFSHSRGMAALRESGKYLPILEREFEHRGEVYKVQIHPARIRYKDNGRKNSIPASERNSSRKRCGKSPVTILMVSISMIKRASNLRSMNCDRNWWRVVMLLMCRILSNR